MKKFLTFIMIAAMTMGSLKAQFSVGVTGGWSNNFHEIDEGYSSYKDYNGNGGSAMVFGRYDFNKWLGIRVDAGWMQRNYSRTQEWEATYDDIHYTSKKEWNFTRNYIMLPVAASFSLGSDKAWNGYVDLGGYIGYLTSGKTNYKGVSTPSGDIDPDANVTEEQLLFLGDKRFDAGFLTRIGFSYTLKCNVFFMFDVSEYIGMVNCHDTGSQYIKQPAYDWTTAIQLGVGYKFKKK